MRAQERQVVRRARPDAGYVGGYLDGNFLPKVTTEALEQLFLLHFRWLLVQIIPRPVRTGPPEAFAQRQSPTLTIKDKRLLRGIRTQGKGLPFGGLPREIGKWAALGGFIAVTVNHPTGLDGPPNHAFWSWLYLRRVEGLRQEDSVRLEPGPFLRQQALQVDPGPAHEHAAQRIRQARIEFPLPGRDALDERCIGWHRGAFLPLLFLLVVREHPIDGGRTKHAEFGQAAFREGEEFRVRRRQREAPPRERRHQPSGNLRRRRLPNVVDDRNLLAAGAQGLSEQRARQALSHD